MRRAGAFLLAILGASLQGDEPKVRAWIGVQKEEPARSWAQSLPRPEDRQLRVQLGSPLDVFRNPRNQAGATVVVWGAASKGRQEEMDRFVHDFAPLFRSAFDTGVSGSVAGQFLSQLVALSANPNQNPAPAIAPAVWYNSQDPWARSPKFYK